MGSFYRDPETNFARYRSRALLVRDARRLRLALPGRLSATAKTAGGFSIGHSCRMYIEKKTAYTADVRWRIRIRILHVYTHAPPVSRCPNRQQRWLHRRQMVPLLTYTCRLPGRLSRSPYSATRFFFLHPPVRLPTHLPTYLSSSLSARSADDCNIPSLNSRVPTGKRTGEAGI